jgi:hypothetical protein
VGQVGVHLDEDIETIGDAPGETVPIGAPQASFGRAAKDVDTTELMSDALNHVSGPVRAAIVDYEDGSAGCRSPELLEDGKDRHPLVVRRYHDQRVG